MWDGNKCLICNDSVCIILLKLILFYIEINIYLHIYEIHNIAPVSVKFIVHQIQQLNIY